MLQMRFKKEERGLNYVKNVTANIQTFKIEWKKQKEHRDPNIRAESRLNMTSSQIACLTI
jgi:hypothetical protein